MVVGKGTAVAVGDESAGLGDDQRASREVPGREEQFKEQFRAPGGDCAEVERRGAAAPDVEGLLEIVVGELERLLAEFLVVGGRPEHHDAVLKRCV